MLTDKEFVSQFSPDLGEDYASAKSYVRDIPTQALVFVRSFTHKLVEHIASNKITFKSPNLYDRIEQLNQLRLVNVTIIRNLHKLRVDGNKGAHPEKFHLTQHQLVALSEKAILQVLALIGALYPVLRHQEAPKFRFVEFDSLAGRDLCYRALMLDDHQAQYLVAMSLKAQALMADDIASKETSQQASKLFKQAGYWFEQAASYNNDALFEHGVSLLHGYTGVADVSQGEQLIAKAAHAGVIDAKALLGYFYLVGSHEFAQDTALAKKWLSEAANAENIEAMANLGVLYYQLDELETAFFWVKQAATSGYPQSQYNLALMYINGEGCDASMKQSEFWYHEAANQGQVDAMLFLAKAILHQTSPTKAQLALAETYLNKAILYGNNLNAMLELSVALVDGVLERIDVVYAAELLVKAKLIANEEELSVIMPLWQSLQWQIEKVITLATSAEELSALKKAQELLAE